MYGGFVGDRIEDRAARDWRTHATVLSGDLLGNDGANFSNNDDNSIHVVSASGGTLVLDGLFVRGGNANGTTTLTQRGGGLDATSASSVTIRNCVFESNSVEWYGGAAFLPNVPVQIINSDFHGNRGVNGSSYGAAVVMGVGGRIDGCLFENNVAVRGTAVCGQAATTTAAVTIVHSTFRNNTATQGVLYFGAGGGTIEVANSVFDGNSGTSGTCGLATQSSNPLTTRLTNTLFLRNSCGGSLVSASDKLYLRNVTAAFGTSSVPFSATSIVYAYNSILREAASGSQFSTTNAVANCNTPGGADPQLDTTTGIPASTSPVINAGNNTYVPADTADVDGDGNTTEILPIDLAGNARIQGGTVDIGAYEVK